MNTNHWLRNYMYLRVTPKGKKPGFRASLATFVTSALWHGFYPGYYLTFVLASVIQTVAKNCRRYFRPFFINPASGQPTSYKIYYDFASWLTTQLAFSFAVAPFMLLTLRDSFLVWSRVYFYCIIGTAAMTAFFASPARAFLKKRIDERSAKATNSLGMKKGWNVSQDSLAGQEPLLGLPADPNKDFEEAVEEIKEEMQARRRRGEKVGVSLQPPETKDI